MTGAPKSESGEERLAKALRDNLRRRKRPQDDQAAAPEPGQPQRGERGRGGEEA